MPKCTQTEIDDLILQNQAFRRDSAEAHRLLDAAGVGERGARLSIRIERLMSDLGYGVSGEGANKCVRPAHNFLGALCRADDCGEPAVGKHAYCKKHQMRYQRHGSPEIVAKRGRKPGRKEAD